MATVVYEQDQSVGMVAKQLRGLTINKHDKWAFAKMAIVAGLFLICCGIYLRCSIVNLFGIESMKIRLLFRCWF